MGLLREKTRFYTKKKQYFSIFNYFFFTENNSTNPLVRISYRNSTEIVEPHVLYIPECGNTCPLQRFIKLYENLLTVNWDYECEKQVCITITSLSLFCQIVNRIGGHFILFNYLHLS